MYSRRMVAVGAGRRREGGWVGRWVEGGRGGEEGGGTPFIVEVI